MSTGIGLVHGTFDPLRGIRRGLMIVLVGQPVEHHGRRQYHGRRIGLALAHDIRRGAVARLEHSVFVADIRGWRDPEAADQSGGEIGENVAEHVLHHHYVEVPRLFHHQRRTSVDIKQVGFYVGKFDFALGKNIALPIEGLEHIGLVDQRELARAATLLTPFEPA